MPRDSRTPEDAAPAASARAGVASLTAGKLPVWIGVAVALLIGTVYLAVASGGSFTFHRSVYPHHLLVADAWLHGQLYVRDAAIQALDDGFYRGYRAAAERSFAAHGQALSDRDWDAIRAHVTPPAELDWSIVDGKRYGYWGPMVSLLLLPYVAVAGLQASDILFSCLVGTGTVLLTFLMLRQAQRCGLVPLSALSCVALTALFGLGTVHFYLIASGRVWFLTQTVGAFFLTMAIMLLLRSGDGARWAFAAGAAFAAAFLARSFLVSTVPFFYLALVALQRQRGAPSNRELTQKALAFTVPLLVAGAVTLAFNHARFGDALESGLHLQILTAGDPRYRQDYLRYGLFSLHYLPHNLYYYFINPALLRDSQTRALTFDPEGNSMFLVTPALLYGLRSYRQRNWFTAALWIGTATCLGLLLLCLFSGWQQFGNRFLLDLMPLAILLIAVGMDGRCTRPALAMILLSIAINAWGAFRFCLG